MELNTIFLIGPQGSGKGTQAKILAEKLNFFYWEMGSILRLTAKEETMLGKKTKTLIDSGVLLSDDDLYEVVRSKLIELPKAQGVIFDGIPRRIGQAEFLIAYLKSQGRTNFTTLFIDLPKEHSLNRLLKRAKVENRADDTLEKIEFRLKQYYQDTLPVLEFLKQSTRFLEIDGLPPVSQVTEDIFKALDIK